MLPGLKRWILFILFGIAFIVYGVFLLLGYHPLDVSLHFIKDFFEDAADVLPHRISGIMVITGGALAIFYAITRMFGSILGAYVPEEDRESIPDVLLRRRTLERGPKIVVIGGGTGLSTLLKGIKIYTNRITAIVTVGDDGGSSGRLRQELGVLPPGDIRNCITALADEDKLVTELFRYRFEQGNGLEGHSFGNLFLTAIYAITGGDMLEAVRVASRVLNSRGQVLPATLTSVNLIAHMSDGREIKGESNISAAGGQIVKLSAETVARATPQAVQAILDAELIIMGPGSLYTSIIPNLIVQGIPEAIKRSSAKKLYICNVRTQQGETSGYSDSDHVQALLSHCDTPTVAAHELVQAVLVNESASNVEANGVSAVVSSDPQRIKDMGIQMICMPLIDEKLPSHHDSTKLAAAIMAWFLNKNKNPGSPQPSDSQLAKGITQRVASLFF